jgi:hypothetical protein
VEGGVLGRLGYTLGENGPRRGSKPARRVANARQYARRAEFFALPTLDSVGSPRAIPTILCFFPNILLQFQGENLYTKKVQFSESV